MSSDKETTYYMELQPGDAVQDGDQWRDQCGQWHPYTFLADISGTVGYGVKARRPIGKTNQTAFEEVPGSRTTQQAIDQPQREQIAYEELRSGTEVQAGDQYRNTQGRWVDYNMDTSGVPIVGPTAMARRPHNITMMLAEFANQAEVLAEVRADEKRLFEDLELLRSEYATVQQERDLARAEVARLSTELWARRPLEDRVTSLTEELARASEETQQLLKTIAENADQFANAGGILQHERDEARAERDKLKGLIDDLLDEPTARQVQDMLRTWATELDWSGCCFDSTGRDKVSAVQRVLVAVIERIEGLVNPEGDVDGN